MSLFSPMESDASPRVVSPARWIQLQRKLEAISVPKGGYAMPREAWQGKGARRMLLWWKAGNHRPAHRRPGRARLVIKEES